MSKTLLFVIQDFIWLSTQESSLLGQTALSFLLPPQDIFKNWIICDFSTEIPTPGILVTATDFHSDDLWVLPLSCLAPHSW